MREPLRVIEGSAKPFEAFWTIRDAANSESGTVEVELFGPISEYSWLGDEVTPKMFKDELYAKGKNGPVTVLVNSPGGEMFAASVIRSILQEYPGKVTADIVGLAASAATIVVTGADHIRMRDSALMMIHDPSALAWGTIDEIKTVLDILSIAKESIIDGYEKKTKIERGKLSKMMKDETWMTARQAQELGFVDEVVTGSIAKAPKNVRAGFLNCLKEYANIPDELKVLEDEEITNVFAEPVSNEPVEAVAEAAQPGAEADGGQRLFDYLSIFGKGVKVEP